MKVFFALPCSGQQISMHTAGALNHTILELAFRRIFPMWSYQSACLPHVRNLLIHTFLNETDATHIFWIDADIGFKPRDVLSLLKLDVDIAVGSYVRKDPNRREHITWKDGAWLNVDDYTEPMEVDSCGLGFACCKREVIETLAKDCVYNNGVPQICVTGLVDGLVCEGEDHAFFKKAKMAGYKIILDPSIKLAHFGTYAYC